MKGKKPKTFAWSAARAVSALSDPTLHTIGISPTRPNRRQQE